MAPAGGCDRDAGRCRRRWRRWRGVRRGQPQVVEGEGRGVALMAGVEEVLPEGQPRRTDPPERVGDSHRGDHRPGLRPGRAECRHHHVVTVGDDGPDRVERDQSRPDRAVRALGEAELRSSVGRTDRHGHSVQACGKAHVEHVGLGVAGGGPAASLGGTQGLRGRGGRARGGRIDHCGDPERHSGCTADALADRVGRRVEPVDRGGGLRRRRSDEDRDHDQRGERAGHRARRGTRLPMMRWGPVLELVWLKS